MSRYNKVMNQLGPVASGNTTLTVDASELNAMDGVTSTSAELNTVDVATPGTAEASKALVLDANKDFTGVRHGTLTGNLTVEGNTRLGNAAADLVGFYDSTGISQRASSLQATTNVASSTDFSTNHLNVLHEIMNTLRLSGLWKGSA